MKRLCTIFSALFIPWTMVHGQNAPSSPAGPYFGQKPPGKMPEIFAPEFFPKDREQHDLFFAPGGLEAVWAERNPADNTTCFVWMRSVDGIWSDPVVLPFSKKYRNIELCLSEDGKRMFFVSDRPAGGTGEPEKTPDLWVSEKTDEGWGEPQQLGLPVNSPDIEAQPYAGSGGSLYFMRQKGNVRRLLCSPAVDGKFAEPAVLDTGLFSFKNQVSGPCVSPDGRIMLVHSRKEGGFGSWDLYASFKDVSGKWSELINMGERINTIESEGTTSFSPDGKYLFFIRKGKVWWVPSGIVETMRPKE